MEKIKSKCRFQNGINFDSDKRSGGLFMGWKSDCKVSFRLYSRSHIDIMIDEDWDGMKWRCTGFYGAFEESQRKASWNLLRCLNECPRIPWIVIGDFNEIAYSSENQEV